MEQSISPDLQFDDGSSRKKIILALVLAAILVWLVLTKTLTAYLAAAAPDWLISAGVNSPAALIDRADRHIVARLRQNAKEKATRSATGATPDSAEILSDEKIKELVLTALPDAPLEATSYRILGQLAESKGDEQDADALMQSASRSSIRDSYAQFYLLRQAYKKGDAKGMLLHANALMPRGEMQSYTVPFLAAIAEKDADREGLVALLRKNPRWRRSFFRLLPTSITNAQTPLNLLVALKTSPVPPTVQEINSYLSFLIKQKRYNLAYYTWLQFLPPEQLSRAGLLFNGDFEFPPDTFPFNWRLIGGRGVTIELSPRPDDISQKALSINFSHGSSQLGATRQTILLTPGRYLFEGKYRGSLRGARGLVWRITCTGVQPPLKVLAETDIFVGQVPKWKSFSKYFDVPETGCPAQIVRVFHDARTESERLISGTAWYDELKITPKFAPAQSADASVSEQANRTGGSGNSDTVQADGARQNMPLDSDSGPQ